MVVATKRRTRGPGRYRVVRGKHAEGHCFIALRSKTAVKDKKLIAELEALSVEELARRGFKKVQAIYGADRVKAANSGPVVDSRSDLDALDPRKFQWVGKGTHSNGATASFDDEDDEFDDGDEPVPVTGDVDDLSPSLEKMSVAQLHDYADAQGIDLGDAARKADIIEAIRAVTGE